MDVALDTSVTVDLVQESAAFDSVREQIIERGARLVIPFLVLAEMAAASDISRTAEQFAIIERQRAALGRRFLVGQDLRPLLRSEKHARGQLWRVPPMRQRAVENLTVSIAAGVRPPRLDQYLLKEETFALDRRVKAEFTKRFPHHDAGSLDASMKDFVFNVTKVGGVGLDWIIGGKPKWLLRQAEKDPSKYPAMMLFAGLVQLQALTASFAEVKNRHVKWPMLVAPDKNDWVDLRIAASAAHAHVFLTRDAWQTARVNFVADRCGLRVRAMSLDEWLASR
jgi:hypothetical protein